MGCDIHVFAEFATAEVSSRLLGYQALSDGEFQVGRSYELFAALAGVRAETTTPLFLPRGIPLDVSQDIASRYFVPVVDDARALAWGIGEHLTLEQATAAVNAGHSHWLPPGMTPPLMPSEHGYVAWPDWHSPSWLEIHEVYQALEHVRRPIESTSDEFQLLMGYLSAVAKKKSTSARIVFWFDN